MTDPLWIEIGIAWAFVSVAWFLHGWVREVIRDRRMRRQESRAVDLIMAWVWSVDDEIAALERMWQWPAVEPRREWR